MGTFERQAAGRVFRRKYEGTAAERCSVRLLLKRHGFPKSVLSSLRAAEGTVLCNGMPVQMNVLLSGGEEITVRFPKETPSEKTVPQELPLDILYEDADLLVVNKQPFLPVHSSGNHHEGTLANAAAWHFAKQREMLENRKNQLAVCAGNTRNGCAGGTSESDGGKGGQSWDGDPQKKVLPVWAAGWETYAPVFHCMNRLDRDTSGVTVITKSHLAAAVLGEAIEAREVHREYLAVVTGITEQRGVIDLPIGRDPDSVILRRVDPENGQSAHTEYERLGIWMPGNRTGCTPEGAAVGCILETAAEGAVGGYVQETAAAEGAAGSPAARGEGSPEAYSLLRVRLGTGRTHQIRVHMKAIGHPLPGDYLYDPDYRYFRRQPLHAYRMCFRHPVTGEQMEFTAPLPEDLRPEGAFEDCMRLFQQEETRQAAIVRTAKTDRNMQGEN